MIFHMNIITIPKEIAKDDLVLIPRKEYESLLELKKMKEFTPTLSQKKTLLKAEENLKKGKSLTYNELVRKLGFKS